MTHDEIAQLKHDIKAAFSLYCKAPVASKAEKLAYELYKELQATLELAKVEE